MTFYDAKKLRKSNFRKNGYKVSISNPVTSSGKRQKDVFHSITVTCFPEMKNVSNNKGEIQTFAECF